MAKAGRIKALIRSQAEGDDARFYAGARWVAASATGSRYGNYALELRDVHDRAKTQSRAASSDGPRRHVALAEPRREWSGLLAASHPETRLGDMALAAPFVTNWTGHGTDNASASAFTRVASHCTESCSSWAHR